MRTIDLDWFNQVGDAGLALTQVISGPVSERWLELCGNNCAVYSLSVNSKVLQNTGKAIRHDSYMCSDDVINIRELVVFSPPSQLL